jgi:ribA/ribD-fused uncharacterized protein
MSDELRRFYKARGKKPDLYTYDTDGNLVELNKEGSIVKTIPLPVYRTPTYEEYDEMEKKRIENIAIANKEYEDARIELRDIYEKPDAPDSEILRINRKVMEADVKLLNIRFPLKRINKEDSIQINNIDFDQPAEKRKFIYDIAFLEVRPFTLQEQYVRIGEVPKKPMISVAEIKAVADQGVPVILFADPETNDYGFLSLNWAVEIEYNGTMYNSIQQALYAEIAKSFNDQPNLEKIMLAETPDEVNYSLTDLSGDPELNEPRWNDLTKQLIYDLNILKFNQYPELAGRLLETKNSMLGAYIPGDTLIGIGISIDNIQSKNPINWTGQNILGKALVDIRNQIRSDREIAQQQEQQSISVPRKPRRGPKVAPSIQPLTEQLIQPVVDETIDIQPTIKVESIAPSDNLTPVDKTE